MSAFFAQNLSILHALAALRTPLLDSVMLFITRFGEESLSLVIALVIFWCVDKRRGYYLMTIVFSGLLANQLLKLLFRIPRPWVLDPTLPIVERARELAIGYSFPSGHTQDACGMFGGFAASSRRRGVRVFCIVLALAVAFSRLYLGVHTPLDVGASVLVAAIAIAAFYPAYRAMERKPAVFALIWCGLAIVSALLAVHVGAQYRLAVATLPVDELDNFTSALKIAYSMIGASLGGLTIYLLDVRRLHFSTDAVWWAQILKVTLGTALVLAVRSVLKAPLQACFGVAGDGVRYFAMILTAGLWTVSFPWFARLGQRRGA